MVNKLTFSMMQCVKCGDKHRISYDYLICEHCGSKQFHIIKNPVTQKMKQTKKGGGFPLLLWIILLIVTITYIILRILKLLGWM